MIGHALYSLGDVIESPSFVSYISMFASLIPIFDVQTGVCCFPPPFRGGILGQTWSNILTHTQTPFEIMMEVELHGFSSYSFIF